MPAERFYIDAELNGNLYLTGSEHHHLTHVMRIRSGEKIELVNGKGVLAKARVGTISKHKCEIQVISSIRTPLLPPRLKLGIPLMRPAKLEFVIEKCTELGADLFYLYPAHFSEKDNLSDHQFERLKMIAVSAMKQCGRLDLPEIKIVSFEEILMHDPIFFGDPRSDRKPQIVQGKLVFITGPEKGFSEKEIKALQNKGTGIRLHKNILRAETAPIAASVLFSTDTI